MAGNVNPAYEDNELHEIETGRLTNGPTNDKEERTIVESSGYVTRGRHALGAFFSKHRRIFRICGTILLNLSVLAYLAVASVHWKETRFEYGFEWCDGYGMLLILLTLTYGGLFYYWVVKRYLGKFIGRWFQPLSNCSEKVQNTKHGALVSQTLIYVSIFTGMIVFLIFDTVDSRDRLKSASGILILLALGWIFSKHPGYIKWRTVFCGLILQFAFGLISIRWAVGRAVFQCVSAKVATFLEFAEHGATFIFSKFLVEDEKVFAFTVLPVIFYFSFIIQILYYLGVMQWIILKLGWLLQAVMGTTICESVVCAGNTFIGMSESPLLIRPYLNRLTTSELHAIMCSGFATVSGTVLSAYIKFGAQPAHLLTASVMAAPAALCYAKLFYPETEKTLTSVENMKLEKSSDTSLLDAATKGAMAGIPIVLGIIANIIAFVSFVALVNALLTWCGYLVGIDGLTLEFILSKVFMPLSWIMGVPWKNCEDVATLIGLKTVVNEFVAYQKLGEFKRAGKLSGRAEAIATYAICGFGNPSSIGIMIGILTSLAPDKKEAITGAILRAFVAGSTVCFLTASTAGMLMNDDFFESEILTTVTDASTTAVY